MHDFKALKIFSGLFSGFVCFQLVLFVLLGAKGLAFLGLIFLIISLLITFYLADRDYSFSAHTLISCMLVYTAMVCYTTGGIYSISIWTFLLVPVFVSLLDRKHTQMIYIGLTAIFFAGICLAQAGQLDIMRPRMIVNISAYRTPGLVVFFLLFGVSIWQILQKNRKTTALMEKSILESRSISDEANNAIKIKDQFLANMSHEIRNPMNGIIGMMHVLLDSDLDAEQRRYSQIVYNSARALLSIVNDILDLSKIEAGKLELDIRNFDLEIAIEDIVSLPELQARQKGIEFSYALSPDVPCLLKGDIGRIRQILNNLAGNAIKFTDAGEVILTVTLKEETDDTAVIHFSIEDTGIGISEEKINSLFQAFTQADSSITKRFGGTGLGLSISKLLVEKMNGEIGVESEEMIGSTFWFTLPLDKQSESEKAFDLFSCDITKCKVLVLSDGSNLGQNFESNLEALMIDYEQAFDETEALEMLKWAVDEDDAFNLLLVEAKESDAHAETLATKIKKDELLQGLKMILLTSIGKKGDARRFEEMGYSAFLSKPVERDLLLDAIKAVVSQAPSSDGAPATIITKYSIQENKKQLKKILIVEDMDTNLLTAKALIGKLGYQTDAAKNGELALEKVFQGDYDLIFMDCQMPVMDGFQATRRIREFEEKNSLEPVPIVAMTGNAFQSDREKCFNSGMNDFIAKPVEPDVLAEKIRRNIRAKTPGSPEKEGDAKDNVEVLSESEFADADLEILERALEPEPEQGGEPEGDLPVFDKEKMWERFGQEEEIIEVVLESFFEEAPELIENLVQAIENNDDEGVRNAAHALKGSSANVNAEALRNVALDLENLSKSGMAEDYGSALKKVKAEYDRFRIVLEG